MGDTLKYTPKPLKSLDQLSKEELQSYIDEQISLGNLPKNWRYAQANRLYRNQEFKKKFGENLWKQVTNKNSNTYMPAEMRDEYYDRQEYLQGVKDRYGNDSDAGQYLYYTTEGLKDLWESNILSNEELKAEEERIKSIYEPSENNVGKQNKFLSSFINAARESDLRRGVPGAKITAINAAASLKGILPEAEEAALTEKLEYQNKVNELKQKGYITEGFSYEHMKSSINNLYSQNQKRKEDLRRREDTRILDLPTVQKAASDIVQSVYADINAGKMTYEEGLKRFDEVFDNDTKNEPSGSRYYTGYKNRSELAKLTAEDKFKTLAEFIVLSEALGDTARAMEIADTKFFNIARANQSWGKRRRNAIRGAGAKANAMAVNGLLSFPVELGHVIFDNAEEYKIYKTAENSLNSKGAGFLLNPNYWNYVDQYAVWDPSEIQRINHNGGIGGRQTLYSPTGEMTVEQFADEGFKMLGYMLPAVAISAVTKNLPRTSRWAKPISWGERVGSAAALGSAYSSGAYNDVMFKGERALDEMFNREAGDFLNSYYKKNSNFVKDYLKSKGVSESDSEIIKAPTILAAEQELYSRAKEAYFKEDEANGGNRRAVYKEAYEQLLKDAKLGASVDAAIETGRMIVSNSFWGKWTTSKLTRDLVNSKSTPIKMVGKEAKQALSKNALRAKEAAQTLFIGGFDNWADDLTVGVGVGLGLGDFNNHIAKKYDPETFVDGAKASADILDGMYWGYEGLREAFYNPQTWIDGALGAAGSILGARFNALTLVRDLIKKEGAFAEKNQDPKVAKAWQDQSTWQHINRYFTNGVIQSIADSDERFAKTEEHLDNFNKIVLPKYEDDIQTLGNILKETIDFNVIADDILSGKDIKQMGMLSSAIRIQDALKDPVLSQIPEVQKFADFLNRGRRGDFTYAELQEYINDPANIKVKNSENAEELAKEALQKNVTNFLTISDEYNNLRNGVAKDSQLTALNELGKTQIATQLVLHKIWEERLKNMQDALGTKGTEKATWNYAAEFGSEEGKKQSIAALRKLLDEQLMQHKIFNELAHKTREKIDSEPDEKLVKKLQNDYELAAFTETYYKNAAEETSRLLEERLKARISFDESGYAPTLSKDEIMRLSPKQRAEMLSKESRSRYSKEQLAIIDELSAELKNHVNENGQSQDLLQVALDAGKMQERIEGSKKSILKVYENPEMLKKYIQRANERRTQMLLEATNSLLRKEQLAKLDEIKSPEEAIEAIFRGKTNKEGIAKGLYIPSDVVKEYLEQHPEASDKLSEAYKMVQTLDDMFLAADSLFTENEATGIKEAITKRTYNSNSAAEVISAIESLIDEQTDTTVKMQYDRVLEKMKEFGYQRDATKLRNREIERQKKQEAEVKRLQEEAKKDGKNYGWEGYKVGDVVYNKETGNSGVVSSFERLQNGANKMVVAVKQNDGTTAYYRYDSTTGKDKLSKEKPAPKNEAPVGAEPIFDDRPIGNPNDPNVVQVGKLEDALTVDADGKVNSPTALQQAAVTGVTPIAVPTVDPTGQGNSLMENDGTISGNRWVVYSIEDLMNGVVKELIPEHPNSLLGKLVEWLKDNNIHLQEIIDEEFGRIITDHPDTEIRFMKMKEQDGRVPLHTLLFNVIELTPEIRNKYHKEERGGIIQANGKSWLVVGTTGFAKDASPEERAAYDTMKAPITKRGNEYFKANEGELYYVDDVARTKVQSTTSGRIVNQALGQESPRLKKVSELLKSAGRTLKQAVFGIQTNEAGEKSFVTTKNAKEGVTVFPPRNAEDNRGRVFILLDTANGNQIPGMIEPAMYNNLAEDSPLKDMINQVITQLFSTNYEARAKAIKELCGYLVLGDEKNILIGKKGGANVLTITREGFPDITQKLGKNFDAIKFFNDLTNANFQINVTTDILNDPVLLKMYDDSNALMTSVDSMRTAGMSYTIYMTDTAGKPIIITPIGNAVPGTGKAVTKVSNSTRVNNNTYENRNGQWINKATKEPVIPGTPLDISCTYNKAIDDSGRAPIATREGKQLFDFQNTDGTVFLAERDGLGNVTLLSAEESKTVLEEINKKIEDNQRAQNLADVDFGDGTVPTVKEAEVEGLTPEQVALQVVGDFETPAQPEIKPQPKKEVVKEAKESQSAQPKEVISDVGNKSLTELQKTENLSTFADVANSIEYESRLYEVLEEKGWGVTGDPAIDAKILQEHNIPIAGIQNVEDWINLIKDCR